MSRAPSRRPRAGTAPRARALTAPAATGAAIAAAAARACYAGLRRRPPGGDATWSRVNHRGEQVTLLEGPAVAFGGLVGTLAGSGLTGRERAALILAGTGAAALGSYDDLAGSGKRRGFRGHLGALAHGEVTTGAVKLIGIGAVGLAAAALARPRPAGTRPGRAGHPGGAGLGRAADVLVDAGLIAGGANLLNLFDLRPGRAIKVGLATGAMMSAASGRGRRAAAAPLAAAAALLPEDLGERAMLGDGGANALGAMLGTAAAVSLPRPARVLTLAAMAGLTAASEVVSFTKVIQRTPALNWLDMLGRRLPAPAQPAPPSASAPAASPVPAAPAAGEAEPGAEGSAAPVPDAPAPAAPAAGGTVAGAAGPGAAGPADAVPAGDNGPAAAAPQ